MEGQKQARTFSVCLPVKSFPRKFQEGFFLAVLFCLDEWVLKVGEREKLSKWGAGMKNRVFYG